MKLLGARNWAITFAFVSFTGFGAFSAIAADRYYAGPSGGNWNNTANWSASDESGPTGASVPAANDSAYLTRFSNDASEFSVAFDMHFPANAFLDLLILKDGGTGTFRLDMNPLPGGQAPVLRTIDVGIGMGGHGIFNQTAGMHVAEDNVYVASGPGSTGAYNLSGGSFEGAFYLAVGQQGASGTVNVTGGAMKGAVILVGGFNGTGEFNLNGNSTVESFEQHIGENGGHGTFNQTGGTNTAKTTLNIGDSEVDSDAVYKLSGGTLIAAKVENTRQFLQTGGTFSISGPFNNSGTATFAGTQQWNAGSSLNATGTSTTTFNSNAGAASTFALKLTAADTAKVHFNTSQNIQTISLNGSSSTDLASSPAADHFINVKQLTISTGQAKLDLNNNSLIVDKTLTTATSIRIQLQRGYHNGAWDGPGITSTSATNDASHNTALGYLDNADGSYAKFLGEPVGISSLIVRYTLYGDANLDGVVDFADLVRVAQNYSRTGTGEWYLGDFNYDGDVGFADLVKVAQNYGASALPAQADLPAGFAADWARAKAAIPEPAGITGLLSAIALLFFRRKSPHKHH